MSRDPQAELRQLEDAGRRALEQQGSLDAREIEETARRRDKKQYGQLCASLAAYQFQPVRRALFAAAVATLVAGGVFYAMDRSPFWQLAIAATMVLVALGAWDGLWGKFARVGAEARWMARQPFKIAGYFEALGDYRSATLGSRAGFSVRFGEPAPSADELRILLASVDGKVMVASQEPHQFDVDLVGRSGANSELVKVVHEVVRVLAVASAKYRVTELTVH